MPDTTATQHDPAAEAQRTEIHTRLLAWYAADGRAHLPWRDTRDPYAILVSEVMLQQTQVERVLPKYREFLARFPTLADLAAAPIADVIKVWSGLGYNMRAVRLHQIAQQAMDEYGGALPDTLDGLLRLKGIGRYTAGAIACFAFGLPVATVDTNIRRVLWRVFRGIEPPAWPSGDRAARDLLALAEWALPIHAAYDWQQALMDLGATLCQSRRPVCEHCPLTACCAAYAETARVTLFPSGEALARLRDGRAADSKAPATPTNTDTADDLRMIAETRAPYTLGEPPPSPTRRTTRPKPSQPFTTTSRYFRGRAVEALRALPPGETLSLSDLGPRVKDNFTPDDLPWLRALLTGLARDGLARITADSDGTERVALP
ncbi:MAG: A/G-specific adenine glycosylase [Ktedonobacterales bacterium]|jgi:A/G-specific adenine glycosylase|nr:MAG: A/G-specific adenine glycosylase [Ktedonobacterales bacterium]